MQARFGIERERYNKLYYKDYTNDKGIFHFHSQIELYMITDGEMEVCVNSCRRLLKKGEMSVALSYDAHAYRTPDESKSSVLIIPLYMCEEFNTAIKHKRVTNPFICNAKAVEKIRNCAMEIRRDDINEVELMGYIYVILGIVMDNIGFEETAGSPDHSLSSRILFYISENYRKEITLASIAAEFGYSRSYISRYFKSCFNIGINRYITVIRLKNALALMHENRYSITYCALESGFNSMRTFYRAFTDEFGCSPREYFAQLETGIKPYIEYIPPTLSAGSSPDIRKE